jgi:methyl-accepting chemotaxis protein
MSKDSRRTYGNFFRYGRLRRRYWLSMLIGGLVMAFILGGTLMQNLLAIQTEAQNVGIAGEPIMNIYDQLAATAESFFFCFIAYTLVATFLIRYLEGRVGNASIAIIDVLEQYKNGNFKHTRELRDGDELEAIMQAVRELGESLRNKVSNR